MFGRYLNHYDNPSHVPPGWDEWASLLYDPRDKGGQYYGYSFSENGTSVKYRSAEADYSTDVIADKVEQFIRNSSGEPFFAWVGMLAPHTPLTPAERHRDTLGGDKRAETLLSVDEAVKGIVETLEVTGELDNTYIFFTSDNGWMEGEHGLYKKQYPYEESASVPLLVRGPEVGTGVQIDSLAANIDLAPTFAELGGTSMAADGRSLVPLFDGTEAEWRKRLLIENPTNDRGPYFAIRTARYKLIDWQDAPDELFDLVQDPKERRNLLDSANVDRAFVRALRKDLKALRFCSGDSCRVASKETLPPSSRDLNPPPAVPL
jgi:arylsulfatase A-like enzyme